MGDAKHEEYLGEFLAHYGVKGMKWGTRRQGGSNTPILPPHPDHIYSRELKSRKTNTLSDAELRALNNRLTLEKQYSDLATSKKKMVAGQKKTKELLNNVTLLNNAYAVVNSPIGELVKTAFAFAASKI